jgi:hypothetical protein
LRVLRRSPRVVTANTVAPSKMPKSKEGMGGRHAIALAASGLSRPISSF